MIYRDKDGEYVAECTDCGAHAYGGTEDDFRRFVQYLKDNQWAVTKEGDEWIHRCPDWTICPQRHGGRVCTPPPRNFVFRR